MYLGYPVERDYFYAAHIPGSVLFWAESALPSFSQMDGNIDLVTQGSSVVEMVDKITW